MAYVKEFNPYLTTIEILCFIDSLIHMMIKFRTAVLLRGPKYSYDFKDIWKAYWEDGFIFDLFGLSPFNILFSMIGIESPLYITIPLRLLRSLIVMNAFTVISHIQILNYRVSSTIYICSIFSSFIFLLHYTSSMWYLINNQVEEDEPITWEKYNNLIDASLVEKITYAIYYTTKIVSGVGSGDSFAATNLERLFTCVIIHIGDVLFTVTFGLIAALASSWSYKMEAYLIRKSQLDDFSKAFRLSSAHKLRVRNYYAYIRDMKYSPTVYQKAKELLPITLAKEIAYETNKCFLLPVFKDIACLNFIKHLAYRIETEHYLPGDYLMHKGDLGEEVYFIADGKISIVAPDKHTVINRLESGAYFGEIGLFFTCRRTYYVQAETHCCICVLKRTAMEELLNKFPAVAEKIRKLGEKRLKQIQEREAQLNEDDEQPHTFTSAVERKEALEEEVKQTPARDKPRGSFAVFQSNPLASNLGLSRRGTFEGLGISSHVDSLLNNASPTIKDRPKKVMEKQIGNREGNVIPRRRPSVKPAPNRRRLSQITFGKHLKLSEKTEVELQWTVLRSPDDGSSTCKHNQ